MNMKRIIYLIYKFYASCWLIGMFGTCIIIFLNLLIIGHVKLIEPNIFILIFELISLIISFPMILEVIKIKNGKNL